MRFSGRTEVPALIFRCFAGLSFVLAVFAQAPGTPGTPQVITFTPVATIQATLGDGTLCTISQGSGSIIIAEFGCVSGDGQTQLSPVLLIAGGKVQGIFQGFDDVLCLLGTNPTMGAVAIGSLGSVPAMTLAWSCSTNIRMLGAVSGQTTPVAGSAAWP